MKNNYPDSLTIQLYLEGKLDFKLAHQLEKQALEDPFLWEALEGYERKKSAVSDLSLLQRQLHERIVHLQENKKVFDLTWQRLSVAATASVLFLTAGILFWMNFDRSKQIASTHPKQVDVTLIDRDSIDSISNDKGAVIVAVPDRTDRAPEQPVFSPKHADAAVDARSSTEILRPVPDSEISGPQAISSAKSAVANTDTPQPKNGWEAFREYVSKNAKTAPQGMASDGAVLLSVKVEPDGSISGTAVVRGINDFYNQEAIRLVKEGIEWVPAPGPNPSEILVEVNFKK